jgi:hypothetical protein
MVDKVLCKRPVEILALLHWPPPEDPLDHPRSPWEAADWCFADGISQVGGLPSWIQLPAYPPCLGCSNLMRFVGQIDLGDIENLGEGIMYGFACPECGLTATTYQQS